MTSRLKVFSLALASAVFAGHAYAADLVEADPVPPTPVEAYETLTWAGFYAGAQLGYGNADGDLTALGVTASGDLDGVVAGGFAGYNWQVDNIVFGIEGDLNYVDFERSGVLGAGTTGGAEIDYIGTIGPRLGFVVDRALIYGEGGFAFAEYGLRNTTGLGTFSTDDTANGWFVGGGVDYALTDNVFVGAEYNFVSLDGDTATLGGTPVTIGDIDTHVFKARVGFKF